MKISLLISIVSHVILLLAFQKLFSLDWDEDRLRTYRVDIIRPPAENLGFEDISEADIARIKEAFENNPVPKAEVETISLDTKDKRFTDYAKKIKQRLLRHWRYPPKAKELLLEGSLRIIFSLGRHGNIVMVEITGNSGHEILDREAVRSIRAAAPFPPFPPHITAKKLNIKASFDYRLTARR